MRAPISGYDQCEVLLISIPTFVCARKNNRKRLTRLVFEAPEYGLSILMNEIQRELEDLVLGMTRIEASSCTSPELYLARIPST